MSKSRIVFAVSLLMSACATFAQVQAAPTPSSRDGSHDFDFEFGEWQVHHRMKPAATGEWAEFDGSASARPLMDGAANVEDNTFHRSTGVTYGVALRTYDPKTREWAIWWVDGRNPHGALDPPMIGHFEASIGRFYSDGELNGKPMRTRFIWSQITPKSARWEQAFSFDAGKTWETNWIMEFRRAPRS
jgi:hypothetical protein